MLAHLLLVLCAVPAADSIPDGTHLRYRGRFVAEKNEGLGEKRFDFTIMYGQAEDRTEAYWTTQEQGQGGWSWLDRFGKTELNGQLHRLDGTTPSLLMERQDLSSVIPLTMPLTTFREPLAIEVAWIEGGLEHRVVGEEQVAGSDCWQVEVRGPVGRKRVMWVEKTSPIVVGMSETVFVGQGEQHRIEYELVQRDLLDSEKSSAAKQAYEEFARVRQRLGFAPQSRELQWTSERLAILKADMPAAVAKAKDTPFAKLAVAAEQESKTDRGRSQALGAFQGKLVGMPTPKPELQTIAGKPFSWTDLEGKVTVLHFWEYRDMPLEEPYGQVAYLDFLFRKHEGGDVRMLGVVADERLAEPDTRRGAIQSAKRLHAFMNLSYPLLLDDGKAIKQFGDPRAAGAKLPLFVVIDRTGKIIHYHAGHYEVNRERGLEELEQVIRQALDNRG